MIDIENLQKIGDGAECVVYRLDKTTVYKHFRGLSPDGAYERSCRAYELGIGPRTWRLDKHGFYQTYCPSVDDADIEMDYKKRNELADKLEAANLGYGENELGRWNIAENNSGDYICLDFGDLSCSMRGMSIDEN